MEKEDYLAKIRHAFPKLAFSKSELIDLGFDHDIVVLDGGFAFRFPKRPGYDMRLAKETRLIKKLQKNISTTIPSYTKIAKDHSFAGYDLVSGKPLNASAFEKLSKKKQHALLVGLAKFLTELHTFRATASTGLLEPLTAVWLQEEWKKEQHTVQSHLRKDHADFLSRFYTVLPALVKHKANCLIHSDLTDWHILVTSGELEGVIDFSDCRFGDPAYDFAWFWEFGKDVVETLYGLYEGQKDARFLERSRYYNIDVNVRFIAFGFHAEDKQLINRAVARITAAHAEMEAFLQSTSHCC